jgi:hypothetical protein
MSEPLVLPSEPISRFLLNDELRPDKVTIRHTAFIPPRTLRHSVYRVSDLSDQQIWTLAVENVEPHRGPVVGRGDLTVSQIMAKHLKLSLDADPASRHANIVDWPEDRNERATIAKELAALASPAKIRDKHTYKVIRSAA